MWLLSNNKILTKYNLIRKKWTRDPLCVLCSQYLETVNHLFLQCFKIQQVLFWLGNSQQYMSNWSNCHDIIQFAE